MKKFLTISICSILFYQCTTVQPVGVKPVEPVYTSDGIGIYRELPKDSFRSPFPYKDLREEAVRVKSVELVSILDIYSLTPGMSFEEVVKKLKSILMILFTHKKMGTESYPMYTKESMKSPMTRKN